MEFNLLDIVTNLFTSNIISKAASSLGESEGSIQKAISGAVPAVLTGILNKAGSGVDASANILNMAKEASGSGILNNPGRFIGGGNETGGKSGLLSMAASLFGDKLGNINSMIANFSGIKLSSASTLINMTTPVALGVIGNHASANKLNARGLLQMLISQKDKEIRRSEDQGVASERRSAGVLSLSVLLIS